MRKNKNEFLWLTICHLLFWITLKNNKEKVKGNEESADRPGQIECKVIIVNMSNFFLTLISQGCSFIWFSPFALLLVIESVFQFYCKLFCSSDNRLNLINMRWFYHSFLYEFGWGCLFTLTSFAFTFMYLGFWLKILNRNE